MLNNGRIDGGWRGTGDVYLDYVFFSMGLSVVRVVCTGNNDVLLLNFGSGWRDAQLENWEQGTHIRLIQRGELFGNTYKSIERNRCKEKLSSECELEWFSFIAKRVAPVFLFNISFSSDFFRIYYRDPVTIRVPNVFPFKTRTCSNETPRRFQHLFDLYQLHFVTSNCSSAPPHLHVDGRGHQWNVPSP